MNKRHLLAVAMAAVLTTGMIGAVTTSVYAAEDKPATTEAPAEEKAMNEEENKDFVKVSEDATTSMRDLHGARLAIFNGEPEKALTFVDAAVTRIGAAVKDADRYALDTKAPKADDAYVPFDANLTVLNTFEPTPENAEHIAKANAHLHKGESKEAVKALKLAEIDVAVTTSLVPVKFAEEYIDQASKFIAEHKYYEANLALKAVDDAVIIETYAIDAVPPTKEEAKG